jgi:hypothetical protein
VQLVAIKPRPGDATHVRADALCAATGLPMYEGRSRLRVLDGWPGIVTTHAETARAEEVAAALRSRGFTAWTMPGAPVEARLLVRRFAIEDALLRVEDDAGTSLQVPLQEVRLALHGTRFTVQSDTVLDHGASEGAGGAAARAVLRLPRNSGVSRVTTRRREQREPFVHLYAADVPVLLFSASALKYAALPLTPVAPTRVANFARVVALLRERLSPTVRFDDRLVARVSQVRMLGPMLPPERHLDVAIALAGDHLSRRDPYR